MYILEKDNYRTGRAIALLYKKGGKNFYMGSFKEDDFDAFDGVCLDLAGCREVVRVADMIAEKGFDAVYRTVGKGTPARATDASPRCGTVPRCDG